MSLVGTRPPTVDEWDKYELHHRARLATKPGLTGMWQVSGRSNITDFEEVVKLDKQYISEWTIYVLSCILWRRRITVVIEGYFCIILFYCLCHYAGLFISQFDCILELVFIVMQVCHYRSPSFLLDFCKVYQDNMKNKIPDQKFLNQHHAYTDKDVFANRFQTFLNKGMIIC